MHDSTGKAYLVGGGISSLAAAVFLVRDAGYSGRNVYVLEGDRVLGGSLDGAGNDVDGYLTRGGRMFEAHFGCTYDLLREIPTLDDPGCSVTEEILRFTREVVPSSRCRLVVDGERLEAPRFGLSLRDRWDLVRLSLASEASLGDATIADWFRPHFFTTHFWTMWCTMFAFQPWHGVVEMRRYMRRFVHLLAGLSRLEGIHRTRLNQYDSIVRPLVCWLREQGVSFALETPVLDVELDPTNERVTALSIRSGGEESSIAVGPQDRVLVTLGSMTEASSTGSMTSVPTRLAEPNDGAWALWRRIAARSPRFGRPERFAGDPEKTLWTSFTVTLPDTAFFDFMESFTGNAAGTGGLVTFERSGWLMSIVLPQQPHFAEQGEDVRVFWGYGLRPDARGDAVARPMLECSGAEILVELAHHLRLRDVQLLAGAQCIPCLMPWITAQFMPRSPGDRPAVIPDRARNFAFLGQFCELPDDTVFTVEYSVRSAQTAVYGLCDVARPVPPMYRGFEDPRVALQALVTLLGDGGGASQT